MSDEQPSAREREEAEALARALEGEAGAAPGDALEVAALLRYARGDDRASAQQLARAREQAQTEPVRTLRRPKVPLVLGSLAVAAAALFAVLSSNAPRSAPAVTEAAAPTRAPAASSLARVLDAQAEALARRELPLTGLSAASAVHRRDLLASLSARYGAGP